MKAKKEAKKLWDSTRDEVTKERYKRARKEVKREVAKAKMMCTKNCTKDWRRRKEKWNCLRNRGIEFLIRLFNRLLHEGRCQMSGGRVCWYHSTREKVI